MNRKLLGVSRIVLVAASLIGLSACGGGGGGSNLMSDVPGGNMPPSGMQPGGGDGGVPMQLTETQLYGDIDAYGRVAANSPNFGSITQSSNGSGISTDRVETTLEAGGEMTLTVRDGTGNVSLELDSRTHLEENLNGTAWMDDTAIDFPANWSGNGWLLSKQDGNDTVVAFAYTSWDDTDDTNYLAGGYWVRVDANDEVTELGTFGDAGPGSVFSYYDGQASSWVKPVSGSATYLGEAEGAYVDPYGDGGVWWSRLRLSADFAANSISGCVGCPQADPAGRDRGVYTYTTIEDLKADLWIAEDLYVALNSGTIGNDGSFEGTLEVLELSTGNGLNSQGKWGGLFSENDNALTQPSQVAGTLGGTADGIGFIGVFLGQQ